MKEIRTYGPPGAGKTTWLAGQIQRAANKYFPKEIMVASFTKAAAIELTSRDLAIPKDCVGTLHAHCYRLLGRPKLAEAHAADFSAAHPHFALRGALGNPDDGPLPAEYGDSAGQGDLLLSRYGLLRNKLTPRALWPESVLSFARTWEAWKNDCGFADFTDLIERAGQELPEFEGKKVMFIDEAQDLTPLQLSLARQWGERMRTFILVGDDDQAIYGFAGASPEAFLSPDLPPDQEIVLSRSYRVPRLVQEAAQKWISGVTRRKEKTYQARAFEGELLQFPGTFKHPAALLNHAERYLEQGKTVMFLCACSYQLQPLIRELRRRGRAFHNPFRRSRGDWNPLTPGNGLATAQRLLAYLEPYFWPTDWLPEQITAWAEMLSAATVFNRGGKARLAELDWPNLKKDPSPAAWAEFAQICAQVFKPGVYAQASSLSLDWLKENATAEYRRRLEFPARVYEAAGLAALKAQPQIIVGTIHSVKGGQADVTYLCPDIAAEAFKAAGQGLARGDASARDSVIRQFYVGMTRCRETLIVTQPATPFTAQKIRVMG